MTESQTTDSIVDSPLIPPKKKKVEKISWEDLVQKHIASDGSKDVRLTCKTIQSASQSDTETKVPPQLTSDDGSTEKDANHDPFIYGTLKNTARFILCGHTQKKLPENLCKLMLEDVSDDRMPDLLMCCFGGEDYFEMNDNLEKEFMDGIAQVANTERVWVLTTGLNKGVPNVVGRSVQRRQLLTPNSSEYTVIGFTGWEAISEYTRQLIQNEVLSSVLNVGLRNIGRKKQRALSLEVGARKLDNHHTHFLLVDSGTVDKNRQLDDKIRSDFVEKIRERTQCRVVTIIVEGGYNTLAVIRNELRNLRPVIIIKGSGRLANILGSLLENVKEEAEPTDDEIKRCIEQNSYPPLARAGRYNEEKTIEQIKKVLKPGTRNHLKVFHLERDQNLTETIFRTIAEGYKPNEQDPRRLLRLAVSWDYIDGADDILKQTSNRLEFSDDLFEQALIENRPKFVDYFLRQSYDLSHAKKTAGNETSPDASNSATNSRNNQNSTMTATPTSSVIQVEHHHAEASACEKEKQRKESCAIYAENFVINKLYQMKNAPFSKNYTVPKTLFRLNGFYEQMTKLYSQPFYSVEDMREEPEESDESNSDHLWKPLLALKNINDPHEGQIMFRDLFFWSVYFGYSNIAFILLLRLKSRIGAALLATNIARFLSKYNDNFDIRNRFNEQAKRYEYYAAHCMKQCHEHNKEFACQLLLREMPVFGNVTCLQIAIAGEIQLFINTPTVNQVLDRQWYGQIDNPHQSWLKTCKLIISLSTFGVTANTLDYRQKDKIERAMLDYETVDHSVETRDKSDKHIRPRGVEEKLTKNETGFRNFKASMELFHSSPFVKMSYHFLVYVWFLLVFSYMMLFEMKPEFKHIRWSEIYLIVTVTAMLIEDLRRECIYYHTGMMKRWNLRKISVSLMYVIPYVLFYVGFGLHRYAKHHSNVLTAARIVYAIDLELWYLISLRFFSAIKLLGPKLIMIRRMMRDLIGFLCLIFVCITAYGVVSRAIFMYDQMRFTALSIFTEVFYRPYWFLYSIIEEETAALDEIISSNKSTSNQVTEATATHVLLTFHMLFINILLLNLLIAVFNFAIQSVHDESEYHWRYQRYRLIEEYFEKPIFAFPPLSLIVYIQLLIQFSVRQCITCQVFKRFSPEELTYGWDEFENAATYRYARELVEKNSRYVRELNEEAEKTAATFDSSQYQRLSSVLENTEHRDKLEARSSLAFFPVDFRKSLVKERENS